VDRTETLYHVPNPDYLRLHDVAGHGTQSVETLGVAATTADRMIVQHDHFVADRASASQQANAERKQTRDRLFILLLHAAKSQISIRSKSRTAAEWDHSSLSTLDTW
jgi:hypothetical protein